MVSRSSNQVQRSSLELSFRELAKQCGSREYLRHEISCARGGQSCDNHSAIEIAHNPVHNEQTKHIEIYKHYSKEKFKSEVINMASIS